MLIRGELLTAAHTVRILQLIFLHGDRLRLLLHQLLLHQLLLHQLLQHRLLLCPYLYMFLNIYVNPQMVHGQIICVCFKLILWYILTCTVRDMLETPSWAGSLCFIYVVLALALFVSITFTTWGVLKSSEHFSAQGILRYFSPQY